MFKLKKDLHYIIIVGCGFLGAYLAARLSEEENNVVVIDKDKNAFNKLPVYYTGFVLNRDANDAGVLIETEAQKADAVIAVTGNDVLNMYILKVAKDIYHVQHVLASLYDSKRIEVYQELGIPTICASDIWLQAFKKEEII